MTCITENYCIQRFEISVESRNLGRTAFATVVVCVVTAVVAAAAAGVSQYRGCLCRFTFSLYSFCGRLLRLLLTLSFLIGILDHK